MESVNLNRLAYFTAVVEAGSFTRAAERRGVTKAVISQQVARLEDELKTSLLLRTTRRVEPTEAGWRLHTRGAMILREAEEAFSELAQSNAEPSGVLRIAAPNDYGTSTVAPLAAAYVRRYPTCTVDLALSDARIDPAANQADLSVRVGWLDDSSLRARRIGTFQQLLVAAPELAAVLDLQAPEDLASVAFIANGALRDPLVWHLTRGDVDQRTVRVRSMLTINATPAVLAATLAGGGLSVLPDFLVADAIASGRLAHVLPNWSLPSGGIYVIYPPTRFRPAKVAAFVDMMLSAHRDQPPRREPDGD